jgi:hypothetical protein
MVCSLKLDVPLDQSNVVQPTFSQLVVRSVDQKEAASAQFTLTTNLAQTLPNGNVSENAQLAKLSIHSDIAIVSIKM